MPLFRRRLIYHWLKSRLRLTGTALLQTMAGANLIASVLLCGVNSQVSARQRSYQIAFFIAPFTNAETRRYIEALALEVNRNSC